MAKSLDNISIEVSQQLFNIQSTTFQHPDSVESSQNAHKPCQTTNIAYHKISQQLSRKKGEREGTESSPPNGVLQNPVRGELGEGEIESTSSPTYEFGRRSRPASWLTKLN
jgi:hypothetical protein